MDEKNRSEILNVLQLLNDYLENIIIGGGWAPILYFNYHKRDNEKFNLFTKDYDFLVPQKIEIKGNKSVHEILTEAGLSEKLLGHSKPPIVHYEGNILDNTVEIEFLTDKSYDRDKDAITVQDGLVAETLEYLKICIDNTMNLSIARGEISDENKNLKVMIPKPAAFVFNKGLVFIRRKDLQKRAKDLYYIFNFISYDDSLFDEIINGIKLFSNIYSKNWFETFRNNLIKYFISEPKEGIDMVLQQRPAGDFSDLDDDQFRNYVEQIFIKLIESFED